MNDKVLDRTQYYNVYRYWFGVYFSSDNYYT